MVRQVARCNIRYETVEGGADWSGSEAQGRDGHRDTGALRPLVLALPADALTPILQGRGRLKAAPDSDTATEAIGWSVSGGVARGESFGESLSWCGEFPPDCNSHRIAHLEPCGYIGSCSEQVNPQDRRRMRRIDGVMPEACRPAESFVLGRRDGIGLELHGGPNIGVVARDGRHAENGRAFWSRKKVIQ